MFEYAPKEDTKPRQDVIPTDLAHAVTLRYASYRELFRTFYFSLGVFFERHFRRHRRRSRSAAR